MGVPAAPANSELAASAFRSTDKATVLQELEVILNSPAFRQSNRSRRFLSFVVQHKLDGREELLKERTIGRARFHQRHRYRVPAAELPARPRLPVRLEFPNLRLPSNPRTPKRKR